MKLASLSKSFAHKTKTCKTYITRITGFIYLINQRKQIIPLPNGEVTEILCVVTTGRVVVVVD